MNKGFQATLRRLWSWLPARAPTISEVENIALRIMVRSSDVNAAEGMEYYASVLGAETQFRLLRAVHGVQPPTVAEGEDVFVALNPHHREDEDQYAYVRQRTVRLNDIVAFVRLHRPDISEAIAREMLLLEAEYLRLNGAAVSLVRSPSSYRVDF